MPDPGEDILDDLVDDILEDLDRENYDPDEFYQEATDFLSLYGYELENEVIWELEESDPVEKVEGRHLEVISEMSDRGDTVYLRFVLEDGRKGNEPPSIDYVEDSHDFDHKTSSQY